jgi:ankyrin repeat protein
MNNEAINQSSQSDVPPSLFDCLPPELIVTIVINLSVGDICRVAQVCRYFAAVTMTASIWSQKAWHQFGFPVELFYQTETSPRQRYRQIKSYWTHPDDSLTTAAEHGHRDLVKFLLPRCQSNAMYWAVRTAICKGHREIVIYCLPHVAHHGYNDFLCQAAKNNQLGIMGELAKLGATAFNSAMSLAAKRGYVEIVKYCYDQGATDINRALSAAAVGGHLETIKYLLEVGATFLDEALSNAAGRGHFNVVDYFLTHCNLGIGSLNWALLAASMGGHVKMVQHLIAAGATELNDALVWAATGGQLDVVHYLVERGADNIDSALTAACYRQHLAVMDYLRNRHE